ncbi:hypothetical protein FDB15_14520 [Clostridium botulinum]|uniref:hypothetical protein n=1 Tax=unclassified Clostridium TaxID=2614128 RepID=UPI000502C2EA|nr:MULTISPECIES: hypothetical protein [unclassified Clostridium]AIY80662.1 hypothetical protein U728_1632 [Clostridium botulinum 202F]KAI3344967.1 syntaphilin domain-containing protein [Clostridium botulinum]KFX53853.1 hypothetical protein KU40_18030 [Clostridium botulinum]KON14016.1 hypothetical protein ACP50_08180 [Clostridium botulinum]MBY6779957.1 hypothetical protein [Clostridium botulinum]
MNEIDMYLSLIDDREANNILKVLKCNVRLDNLELKKTKIRTMIRTNQSKKLFKENISPFSVIIIRHNIKEWNHLNEKEFLITLNKMEEIPDYVKFANLMMKFPDKKNKYIELINENKNNNKYVFDFDLNFDNKEEIIRYYSKLSENQEDLLKNIDMYSHKAVDLGLLQKDNENRKDIINWDIIKLYNELKSHSPDENMFMKYEYIRTHNDIDKNILNNLYQDILFHLLSIFVDSGADVNKSESLKLKTEIDKLQNDYKKAEKDKVEKTKEYKKEIKTLKQELDLTKSKITELDKMKTELEIYSNKNDSLLKQMNELKEKNNLLDTQLKNNKKELKFYEKQVNNMQLYYKYNFSQNENNEKIFGVIHSTNINIVKIIFSEVEFIPIDDWKKAIKDIKKIYIQREGIPTSELTKIKNYCSKNGIDIIRNISIPDEKSLIEIISIEKVKKK